MNKSKERIEFFMVLFSLFGMLSLVDRIFSINVTGFVFLFLGIFGYIYEKYKGGKK